MVEVFKTNVKKSKQAVSLVAVLSGRFANFSIHFDLEDCDKILRIEGQHIEPNEIIEMVQSNGYQCEILL